MRKHEQYFVVDQQQVLLVQTPSLSPINPDPWTLLGFPHVLHRADPSLVPSGIRDELGVPHPGTGALFARLQPIWSKENPIPLSMVGGYPKMDGF